MALREAHLAPKTLNALECGLVKQLLVGRGVMPKLLQQCVETWRSKKRTYTKAESCFDVDLTGMLYSWWSDIFVSWWVWLRTEFLVSVAPGKNGNVIKELKIETSMRGGSLQRNFEKVLAFRF